MFRSTQQGKDVWGSKSLAASRAASTSNTSGVSIKKTDADEQIVFGEVYAPGFPDSHGDFMKSETIKKMAYDFLRKGNQSQIDLHHTQQVSGCYVVESFIARDDDPVFIPGAWVIGVKVPDPEIWALVKSGDLNGFSFDGTGVRVETTLEIDMPESLQGMTDEVVGHAHVFTVRYSDEGAFLGGTTDQGPDGHVHKILRGTVTEDAADHAHRFSFVEGVLGAQVAN